MGNCYINSKKKDEKIFEKSIEINPDYAENLTNYGFIIAKA